MKCIYQIFENFQNTLYLDPIHLQRVSRNSVYRLLCASSQNFNIVVNEFDWLGTRFKVRISKKVIVICQCYSTGPEAAG